MTAGRARPTTAREVDDAAARFAARARVVVLTLAAVAAAIVWGEDAHPGFQYTLAFAALPGAVALALASDRLRPSRSAGLGAVIDTVLFAAALVAIPDAMSALTAAFAVGLLVAAYTGGGLVGALTGAAGIGVLLVLDLLDRIPPTGELVVLLVVAVAASLAVVGRTDARLLRSAGRARELEARATLMIEHMPEPIVVIGERGRLVQYNDAADQLLDLTLAGARTCADALGLEIDGLRLDCSATCALMAVEGSLDSGGVEAVASACAAASGERTTGVPVLVNVAPLPSGDDTGIQYLHSIRDITRLKMADEAKTLFLATTTHELKTPLTVIRGFLETIDHPDMESEMRQTAITVMRRRADELANIIDRILLASRIEAGHLEIDVHPIQAVAVARERVAALAAATARTIALHTPGDVPHVLGDGPTLATVLDHLLDNASKYSPRAAPITVDVTVGERAVQLAVRDRGVGMTPDEMSHCFDRFWQADPTSRRKVGGTGIGLYIVRSLVHSMQGTVGVSSWSGHGTCFEVTMPRADVARAPTPSAVSEEPAPERSIVREFMRQIGVDTNREPAP